LREGGYGIVKRASCGVPFYFSAFLGTGRSSPKMARCAVLIDGGYLDKVQAEDFGNTRVDIGRFGDELAGAMERLRTYYYHCMPFQSTTPTPEERTSYAAMDSFIFNLKKL